MEQNHFAEQIVARGIEKTTIFKKLAVAIICSVILIIVSSIPALITFMPILCVGLVAIAIALVRSFNIEYEYTFAEGEFSVDVIRGKSRRTRKLTLPLSRVTSFIRASDASAKELCDAASQRFDFSSSPNADGRFALLADSENGRISVIIEPNEKMYSHIVSSLPGSVRMSIKDND